MAALVERHGGEFVRDRAIGNLARLREHFTGALFSLHVVAADLLVHFTLSMIYSTVGSIVFRWLALRWAIPTGLALGLLLYAINFHGFAQHFEWFKEARGWPAITIHAIYGLAAAVTHKLREPEHSNS